MFFLSPKGSARPTKAELLHDVLSDGAWHSTMELAREVGHTFHVAKRKLTLYGYVIQRQSHPTKRHQHQYRLVDEP